MPDALVLEFLSVAVSGGSAHWADITEQRRDMARFPLYASARFTERASGFSTIISKDVVGAGIARLVADSAGVPQGVREKVLRALVNQGGGEVDMEMADYVVRAAMRVSEPA